MQEEHVAQYWTDIERARAADDAYFMGTVVLASDEDGDNRKLIIDGQQRITTTAILFIAIRDRLRELDQDRAAQSVEDTHLSDCVLTEEQTVAKLTLSADDHRVFAVLLEGDSADQLGDDRLSACYQQLKTHTDGLAQRKADYRRLIELVDYLDKQVQVLLAVASGLPEAYIIFGTLNDRGADLTTADLLKNYLFNQAGRSGISHAESIWTRISGRFDNPDELVKFLRYEYMSRKGQVTNRCLYKALQADIGQGARSVRSYLDRLEKMLQRYVALREPDDARARRWSLIW